jgi:hypothetical protein
MRQAHPVRSAVCPRHESAAFETAMVIAAERSTDLVPVQNTELGHADSQLAVLALLDHPDDHLHQ